MFRCRLQTIIPNTHPPTHNTKKQLFGTSLNFTMNVMNGFVLPYNLIPVWFKWLNRIVPTTWVVYGLSVSQLGEERSCWVVGCVLCVCLCALGKEAKKRSTRSSPLAL